MTHSNFIDAAMSYVETFDVPVFPCEPLGKRPLARLAPNGLKNATTDKATIEKWGRAVPDANVGVVTGITFDAFDIDAAGWSTIARLVNDHGCMTLGPVAITPNNGAHDLFAATGLGNRAGFKPGLDWHGAKGYIVGVGSILANRPLRMGDPARQCASCRRADVARRTADTTTRDDLGTVE